MFSFEKTFEDPKTYLISVAISIAYIIIYWHIDRGIIIYFRKKLPKDSQYRKRLILQSIVIVFITLTLCSIIDFLIINQLPHWMNDGSRIPYALTVMVSLVITIVVVSIYEAWYAFDLYRVGLIQNEELKKENTIAQLQTLKIKLTHTFFLTH